jgi:hypothetical protein
MKAFIFITSALFLTLLSLAQQAKVVAFKHELRWTEESRFPYYFVMPEFRDSVFNDTRMELMKYLSVRDVTFPDKVEYKIINGFGKQKTEMPSGGSANDPAIGIFSFITRATSGYAMFWKFTVVIKKNNKTILEKEVSHELEYANVSGYVDSQLWITPEEFRQIFHRLVNEALGFEPASGEKILLGLDKAMQDNVQALLMLDAAEKEADSLLAGPSRCLLKMNGAWKSAGNFAAMLESGKDTILDFYFKQGGTQEWPKPSFSSVLSNLFAEATGIGIEYEQKVANQINGKLLFADGQRFGIKLKWIEIATRTTAGDEISSRITAPLTAELYNDKEQVGYFLYSRREEVQATNETKETFNVFTGRQNENTMGVELVHRIEGSLFGRPVSVEYNESQGLIKIMSGDGILGIMVVRNCNPESNSVGNVALSKNKRFMVSSGHNIGKPSLENEKHVEWYPVYFPANATDDSMKISIETLICLFFGMGNM